MAPEGAIRAVAFGLFLLVPIAANRVQAADPPKVSDPPAGRFDPFYKKMVKVRDLPVLASEKVSDHALFEAADLIGRMLEGRDDILDAMAKNGVRYVVIANAERTTDIPEYRTMTPKDFWDVRARGLGATRQRPVVSCGEENLLGYRGDPYRGENILIHEFAHAIHGMGLNTVDPTFDARLRKTFESAQKKGLWKGTYAGTNAGEYWGEGVQSWFDCNLNPPDFQHNDVSTREKLKAYDPDLAALIADVFGDRPWRYRLPSQRKDLADSHLAGYDPKKAPEFSWGAAKKKYDEVVAEKKRKREEERRALEKAEEKPRH